MLTLTLGVVSYIQQMGVANIKAAYQSQIGAEREGFSPVDSEERSLYTLVRGVIVEGLKKGKLRNDMTADEMTHSVIRTQRGVIFDWCLANGGFDLEKESMRVFNLVLDGIRRK